MARIDKENYYLDIAETVLKRATCLRRCYGCHYRQERRDYLHRLQRRAQRAQELHRLGLLHPGQPSRCPRGSGTSCAAASMPRPTVLSPPPAAPFWGGTLYLAGRDSKTGELLPDATSCSMCRRLIINAGIDRVVIRRTPSEYTAVHVEDWIREDDSLPPALG